MMGRPRGVSLAIAVLALAGMAVSSMSLAHHYSDSGSDSFCAFDDSFNCDIVNKSIYSEVLGVPVALIGIAGYAALLALAFVGRSSASALTLLGALAGLAFALYLTYVEAYVLGVWCILCLSSLAVIALIAGLSVLRFQQRPRPA